jgi:hypothetical protein
MEVLIMLTISPPALALIQEKNQPIFLDIPPLIGCCIHVKEAPTIRFGQPHDPSNYSCQTIQGVTVFVPHELPDVPLSIQVSQFLWKKYLVVAGWCLA